MNKSLCLLGLVLTLGLAGVAAADTIEYTFGFGPQGTDWATTWNAPLFNPGLGTLTGIYFELYGEVTGSEGLENLSTNARTIDSFIQATITMTRPDLSVLVVTTPIANFSDDLGAYDLLTDYGGSSGVTHSNILSSDTDSATSPPPASDLALFSGIGTIALPIDAVGNSGASGGQVSYVSDISAETEAKIRYTYTTEAIPEPGTFALIGLGLVGLAAAVRRRREAA